MTQYIVIWVYLLDSTSSDVAVHCAIIYVQCYYPYKYHAWISFINRASMFHVLQYRYGYNTMYYITTLHYSHALLGAVTFDQMTSDQTTSAVPTSAALTTSAPTTAVMTHDQCVNCCW